MRAVAWLLLLLWPALAQGPRLPPLSPEEVLGKVAAYLGQAEGVYKFQFRHRPREGLWVYEVRLPGAEVWVEAGSRRVILFRPRGIPRHLAEPHLPFQEVLARVRSRYGEPWHLELKPRPREGLLVWEVQGPFGEVWLEAATGREVFRR